VIAGALGDIHGDFDSVRRIVCRHPEVPVWISVGDVADAEGHDQPVDSPLYRIDAGKTPINEVLAEMRPRLHLFGHHHRCTDQERQGVRSIGLNHVSESYVLIDARSMAVERRS
jgi:hypothetical protein